MSAWLAGRVLENKAWTDTLFSLRVQLGTGAPSLRFDAGQFVRIALEEKLARPFSFVNPPQDPVLEFYGIVVPEGPLSPLLSRLPSWLSSITLRASTASPSRSTVVASTPEIRWYGSDESVRAATISRSVELGSPS